MTTAKLDLSHVHARTILTRRCSALRLVQVGCGGIGGMLAPHTARIARECQRFYRQVDVLFIDPDRIEDKNIRRQNFCQAEIGQNKAEALAYRFNAAWGLEIEAIPKPFTPQTLPSTHYNTLTILLGGVDNAAARRQLHKFLEREGAHHNDGSPVWWVDGGNLSTHGQVLIGNTLSPTLLAKSFDLPGICKNLPSPGLLHPELLSPRPEELVRKQLSCSELAMADPQSLTINTIIAAHMADYLLRLAVTHDLRRFATYIDMNTGSVRSLAATPAQVAQALAHLPKLSHKIPLAA